MEPNLEEMSDYKKPLGKSKMKAIVIAFAIAIAVYIAYAIVMSVM
jgi:hypothetical protein